MSRKSLRNFAKCTVLAKESYILASSLNLANLSVNLALLNATLMCRSVATVPWMLSPSMILLPTASRISGSTTDGRATERLSIG